MLSSGTSKVLAKSAVDGIVGNDVRIHVINDGHALLIAVYIRDSLGLCNGDLYDPESAFSALHCLKKLNYIEKKEYGKIKQALSLHFVEIFVIY